VGRGKELIEKRDEVRTWTPSGPFFLFLAFTSFFFVKGCSGGDWEKSY
jgi:hypothetical protein